MHLELAVPFFIPNFRALIPTLRIFLVETRQYCKDMGSPGNYRGQMEAAATSDSAAALVGQMQTQLRDLASRREDLVRRIRNLHQVMRGLREISSAPIFTHPCEEPPSTAGRHLQSSMQRKTDTVNVHLQRACRIALLEAERPVSLEEICARIVRRGSFSFVDPECANPVLLQVLNAMAQCGEVHLLESAPCWRWERVAPLKEA